MDTKFYLRLGTMWRTLMGCFWWAGWRFKVVVDRAKIAFRFAGRAVIGIDATIGSIFADLVDAKQKWIVENIDDALAGYDWIIAIAFVAAVLIIRQLECVARAILNHNGTVQLCGKDDSRIYRTRLVLLVSVVVVVIVVLWKAC